MMDTFSADKLKFMYLFPTFGQMKDFMKSRIRVQTGVGYYNSILDKNNDSVQQMSIRDSTCFFRSGSNAKQVEGVDVSVLFEDEFERIPSDGETSAIQSMASAGKIYGLVRRFSTPSVFNYGISKKYEESDQRKWMIKCEHCGYWQEMTYNKNVKVIDEDLIDNKSKIAKPGSCMFVCQKCGKDLNSSRWYNGEWVSTYPNQNKPVGFYTSQLDCVWITPEEIVTKKMQSENLQFFYNYTLGVPYENAQVGMTTEDILSHRADDLPERITHYTTGKYAYVVFGIDFG